MHEEEAFARGDLARWLERLVAADIDVVVTLHPSPVEYSWMEANPDLFELIAKSAEGWNRAFRFHKERLGSVVLSRPGQGQ